MTYRPKCGHLIAHRLSVAMTRRRAHKTGPVGSCLVCTITIQHYNILSYDNASIKYISRGGGRIRTLRWLPSSQFSRIGLMNIKTAALWTHTKYREGCCRFAASSGDNIIITRARDNITLFSYNKIYIIPIPKAGVDFQLPAAENDSARNGFFTRSHSGHHRRPLFAFRRVLLRTRNTRFYLFFFFSPCPRLFIQGRIHLARVMWAFSYEHLEEK